MIVKVVLKSGKVRYRVRYRTPDYRIRTSTFDRRRDAEDFEADTRRTLRAGTFIDPARGKLTLRALWEEYDRTATTHLRATTRQNYRAASRHFPVRQAEVRHPF